MRLPETDLAMIDRAASLRGRTRADFMRKDAFETFMAVAAPALPVAEMVGMLCGALQGGCLRAPRLPEEVAQGIRIAQVDVDLVERRLTVTQQDYEARHGKPKS